MNPIASAALGSILRWLLALGSGWLVTKGIWTEAEATTYITAAALGILSLGWSLWQKYKSRKTVLTALMMPQGKTEDDVTDFIKQGNVTPAITTPSDTAPGVPDTTKKE